MSRGMKFGIAVAGPGRARRGWLFFKKQQEKNKATEVRMEPVGRKDLVAAVTASGKIEAETKVDISADITGRILKIAVKEGDLVTKGQFLLQIDPAQYEARGRPRARRCLASSQASLVQAQANRDQAKRQLRPGEASCRRPTRT